MAGPLPEDRIKLSQHAHVRGWDRLGLPMAQRRRAVVGVLQTGSWYAHPEQHDTWLVLGRVARDWLCAITKVDQRTLRVATVWPLTNPGQLDPYKRHNPQGPWDAAAIAAHYSLRGP